MNVCSGIPQINWGPPQDYYHIDIGEGEPQCGLEFNTNADVISLGDTDDKASLPIGFIKCPDCLWLPDNPNQTDLFR